MNGKFEEYIREIRLPGEITFYTIRDIAEMTGWPVSTVEKLFQQPSFPSFDYGNTKAVEARVLIHFFSKRHDRPKKKK